MICSLRSSSAWTLITTTDFKFVEVMIETIVSSPKSKQNHLFFAGEMVEGIVFVVLGMLLLPFFFLFGFDDCSSF